MGAELFAVLASLGLFEDPMLLFTNRSMNDVVYGWEDDLLTTLHDLAMPQLPTRYPGFQENDTSADIARYKHKRDRIYTGLHTEDRAVRGVLLCTRAHSAVTAYNTPPHRKSCLQREYLTWDGMDDMLCCAYGPCGNVDSGTLTPGVKPWHTDSAVQIQGVMVRGRVYAS